MLLWLRYRPAATAPIRSLAWEPPYAAGVALEMAKRQKQTNKQKNNNKIEIFLLVKLIKESPAYLHCTELGCYFNFHRMIGMRTTEYVYYKQKSMPFEMFSVVHLKGSSSCTSL